MFREQPIQYTDVSTTNYKDEDDCDLITGYKLGKYQNFLPSVKLFVLNIFIIKNFSFIIIF
jgi:hypothetical protein